MTKPINISIKEPIIGLFGYSNGKKLFNEQVKPQINADKYNIKIIFPNKIKRITTSFAKGFLAELLQKYGYNNVKKSVIIQTSDPNLSKSIFEICN